MFCSREQIEQSMSRLDRLNPFFGTVFLAFKKAELPIVQTKNIRFATLVNEILQAYYPYYRPTVDAKDHRIYSPFKTSNKSNRWNKEPYSGTLRRIADDTFFDALDHVSSNKWGWKSDYINILKENHLSEGLIPAFDLAVWLFREQQWDKDVQSVDLIAELFTEFHILQEEEQQLFDTTIPPLAQPWLQEQPFTIEALLEIVGHPLGNVILEGATLELLKMTGVGPGRQIECDLTPRLNIITGDNGLGKTFLLECAWWVLTGVWSSPYLIRPRQDVPKTSIQIAFRLGKDAVSGGQQVTKYNWDSLEWSPITKGNMTAGLTIFAHIDGSFSIWDPAKSRLPDEVRNPEEESDALIHFSWVEVLNGVTRGQGRRERVLCDGLIRDWVTWQSSDPVRFAQFCAVLKELSARKEDEQLIPGKPQRMTGDARPIPTLKFPYDEIPIVLCSSGIQRVVSLAYLLVWAWNEHVVTTQRMRKTQQQSIILLVDEMEAHLHPFWQRTIIPALLDVVQHLASEVQIQLLLTTHSPLVLASAEPRFDEERDSLFHLYLDPEDNSVQLDNVPFVKRGRVDQWLTSDIFGLAEPRSKDAEETIENARELQLTENPSPEKVQAISDRLRAVLAPDDEFWPLWTYFAKERGARFDAH